MLFYKCIVAAEYVWWNFYAGIMKDRGGFFSGHHYLAFCILYSLFHTCLTGSDQNIEWLTPEYFGPFVYN